MGFKEWWKKRSNTFKGFVLGFPLYYVVLFLIIIVKTIGAAITGFKGPYYCSLGPTTVGCSYSSSLSETVFVFLFFAAILYVPLCMILGAIIGLFLDIRKRIKKKR